MKTWSVNIPVLVREVGEHPERDDREYAMAMPFKVRAETAKEAAQALRDRISDVARDQRIVDTTLVQGCGR